MKKLLILICMCITLAPVNAENYILVSSYSSNANRAVRWPDGDVKIFDATNYDEIDKALDLLNKYTNKTHFIKTDNPENAQIIISWSDYFDFPYQDKCGLTQTFLQDKYKYTKATIQLRRGACTKNGTILSLYIHELGHALGFERHTDSEDVMAEALQDRGHFESIGILTTFLTGLYYLQPGDIINKDTLIPRTSGANIVHKNTDISTKLQREADVSKRVKLKNNMEEPTTLITIIPNKQSGNVIYQNNDSKIKTKIDNDKYKQIN